MIVVSRGDKGMPVSASDVRKLLADSPNEIRDVLGIMADVRFVERDGRDLIEIRVDPDPYLVNSKGEYHNRPRSTKQEAKKVILVHHDRLTIWNPGHLPPNWTLEKLKEEGILHRAGLAAARARGRRGGRPYKMTPAKLRLATAALANRNTNVRELCAELGITRQTLYRHLHPNGQLRPDGLKLMTRGSLPTADSR